MTTMIYMPLINEGTSVWRPVSAEHAGDCAYLVIDREPEGEEWAVAFGMTVLVDGKMRITRAAGGMQHSPIN